MILSYVVCPLSPSASTYMSDFSEGLHPYCSYGWIDVNLPTVPLLSDPQIYQCCVINVDRGVF